MNRNRLYDAAFAFRALKLWDKLADDQIFAIQMKDQICYISITGMLGEHYSLGVYPGQEGIDSLWRIYQMSAVSESEEMAAFFGRSALICAFVPRDELEPESLAVLSPYLKARGMSIRGKKALWPQILRCRPYREFVYAYGEADAETMTEALEAACWLNGNSGRPIDTLAHLSEHDQTLPLLRREGDSWKIENLPMPPEPDISYPIGHTFNEMYTARARKLEKKGTWACKIRLDPVPRDADGIEEKVLPWMLLTVDLDTGREISVQPVRDYETRTEVMLDKMMEAMFRENVCPKAFCVYDERTFSLLEDWSAEMGIALSMEEEIPEELENLEDFADAQAYMGEEDSMQFMEEMLDLMLLLPDQELFLNQPELAEYIAHFRELQLHPDTPESIRAKVSEILERYDNFQSRQQSGAGKSTGKKSKGKKGKKATVPEKSLVISVSLDTGCYRHIRISDQALLEDLSLEILRAFNFDNDHLHGFFMDNQAYSPWDAYYSHDSEEGPATDQVTLAEAGMTAGKKFKYVFDFGDDWTFQCRVLRELDEITAEPVIIRKKGEAPPQYPEWDEEDWDEEDWDDDDE